MALDDHDEPGSQYWKKMPSASVSIPCLLLFGHLFAVKGRTSQSDHEICVSVKPARGKQTTGPPLVIYFRDMSNVISIPRMLAVTFLLFPHVYDR